MNVSKSVWLKPMFIMIAIQLSFGWINIFYKLAQNDGMSFRVIVAYRFIFASFFLIPVSLYYEREARHTLDKLVIFQAFLCSIFGGVLCQNLYLESLALTTSTFVSATLNLTPGVTFVLAVLLRIEKVGVVKVAGTLTGIAGAMTITFVKGVPLNIFPTHINLLKTVNKNHVASPHNGNPLAGSAMGLASCVSFSVWLIIQKKMLEKFPYPYTATAITAIIGAVFSSGFALCFDRGPGDWALGFNIRLATVAYAGILVSGVMFSLMTWCLQISSPLFVSSFSPLMLVVSAISGTAFLGEIPCIGSVLGSVLIIIGLYLVLWGKSKDMMSSVESNACHIECKT